MFIAKVIYWGTKLGHKDSTIIALLIFHTSQAECSNDIYSNIVIFEIYFVILWFGYFYF